MDRETVKLYKNRLLELRTRLRDDASQMACVPDCEMSLQLLTSKEQMLQEIEYALEQIEDGAYGKCKRCDRNIPRTRLMVVPYTTLCTRCAARIPDWPESSSRPSFAEAAEMDDQRIPRGTGRPVVRSLAAGKSRSRQTSGRADRAAR